MLIKKLFYFVESIPKKVSVRIYSIINHLRFHIYADVGGEFMLIIRYTCQLILKRNSLLVKSLL